MCDQENNLKTVIIALLRKAGDDGLTKTRLIKLVFFTDLEACRTGLGVLTDSEYRTQDYGIVDFRIWDYVSEELADSRNIICHAGSTQYGSPVFQITLKNDEFEPSPVEIAGLIDSVWEKYGHLNSVELGNLTKELVPMEDEWETGVLVDPRDIVYEESEEFQSHCRNVLENYPKQHSPVVPIKEFLNG